MKKSIKIIRNTIIVLLGTILLLPPLLYAIIAGIVLTPQKLATITNKTSKQFINGEFTAEKIDFTFFSTFPRFTLFAENGALISYCGLDSATINTRQFQAQDSLIRFEKIYFDIAPLQFIFDNRLAINDISIINPQIYAYTSSRQINNWDIVESDTTQKESAPLPKFDINSITIENATLRYTDAQNNTDFTVNGIKCAFSGIRKKTEQTLDLLLQSTDFSLKSPGMSFKNDLLTKLTANVEIDEIEKKGILRNAHLLLNKLELSANGFVRLDPDSMAGDMDLSFDLAMPGLGELSKLIPDTIYPFAQNFDASGTMGLNIRAHGPFNDTIMPILDILANIENGKLVPKKEIDGIDQIALDAALHIDPQHNDSCRFKLNRLLVKSNYINLKANAIVNRLFTYPYTNAQIKGFINLMAFTRNFPSKNETVVDGIITYDLGSNFALADLTAKAFDKIKIDGKIKFPRIRIESKKDTFKLYAQKGDMNFSSSKRNPSFLQGEKFFGGNFRFDTLHIEMGNELNANLKNPEIIYGTKISKDSTVAQPMFVAVRMDRLNGSSEQNNKIRIGKSLAYCAIMPIDENTKKQRITASIKGDDMFYRSPEGWAQLKNADINLKIRPFLSDTTTQKKRKTFAANDSLRTRQIPNDTENSLLSPNTIRNLRKWRATGDIAFRNLRARTPYFPITLKMDSTIIEFTDNNIKLKKARVRIASSDVTLTGELKQLRKALFRGGLFKGELDVSSTNININEILYGIDKGTQYAELSAAKKQKQYEEETEESLTDNEQNEEEIAAAADSLSENMQLFTVPKNVDLTLHLDAKKIQYKNLQLDDTEGEIVIKDKTLQLTQLNIQSNAGNAGLSLLYKNLRKKEAFAGFDLKMRDIQVNELIKLMPSIDSLLPMLRSFEGVVTCDLAAASKLDSASNLILPTLNAACYLRGKDMVLLDGETFAEISKKLFFKNKKRNIIDSISVEIIAKNNQIEIFPFLLEIDRYKVAAGGTQNLDMTFNYHISVLKSPLPFKIGIDVFGNVDDIKFRLKRPKYKNIFSASSRKQLDKERINIRENIYKTLQKEIHMGTLFVSEKDLNKIDSMAVMDIEPDSVMEVDSIPQSFLDSIQNVVEQPLP